MPVIRVRDDTWQRLKRWAVPLEDTADSAVRKALDAAERLPCPDREWLLRGVQVFLDNEGLDAPLRAERLTDHLLGNWEMVVLSYRMRKDQR